MIRCCQVVRNSDDGLICRARRIGMKVATAEMATSERIRVVIINCLLGHETGPTR